MADAKKCLRCGEDHEVYECSLVKAVEFDADMNLTRVEFLTPADYPRQRREGDDAQQDYPRLGPKKGS